MGRDHGHECEKCGVYVGGFNDPDERGHDPGCDQARLDPSGPAQADLVGYRHRFCGGRVHLENRNEWDAPRLVAVCAECGDTDGLDLEGVPLAAAIRTQGPDLTREEALALVQAANTASPAWRNFHGATGKSAEEKLRAFLASGDAET